MRPVIGLTVYDGISRSQLPISAINTAYVEAIRQAGGLPVLIPNQLHDGEWRDLYPRMNGILFTGGGDISLAHFAGSPHAKIDEVDENRDSLELSLFQQAAQDGKPFLGICRGCQIANVALGGTLYTHIQDQLPGALKHDWYPDIPRTTLAHSVQVDEDSRSAKIFGERILQVNSLHHQGIKDLAPGLVAVGHAPDNLVEVVEIPDHPFGIAVQWHPEWLTDQQAMSRLFSEFVEASSR
jgi:putative glutamine amidotransferase